MSVTSVFKSFLETNKFRFKKYSFNHLINLKDARQILYEYEGDMYVANFYVIDSFDYDWIHIELFCKDFKASEHSIDINDINDHVKHYYIEYVSINKDDIQQIKLFPKDHQTPALFVSLSEAAPYVSEKRNATLFV